MKTATKPHSAILWLMQLWPKDGKILLIRRAAHLTNGGKWAIPGGFLDRDETCEQAVLREVKEETGLNGKIIKLFKITDDPARKNEDRQN